MNLEPQSHEDPRDANECRICGEQSRRTVTVNYHGWSPRQTYCVDCIEALAVAAAATEEAA
jgi:hypothetical protein